MNTITSDLEEDTFFESGGNNGTSNGSGANQGCALNNIQKRSSSAKDQIFWDIAESNQQAAEASQQKNQAVKLAAITQTRATLQSMLDNAQSKTKEALKGLKMHPFCRRDNKRIQIIVNSVNKCTKEAAAANGDSTAAKENFPLSQETTLSIQDLGSFDTVFGLATEYNDGKEEADPCHSSLKKLS